MSAAVDREALADAANPLGLDGIEFIEYATRKPQALGQVLDRAARPGRSPIGRVHGADRGSADRPTRDARRAAAGLC
jgi:hypothetical protein